MSNFGVTYLLKKNKGNNRLSIEDNIGEEIHIHFGNMRLMLSNKEFRELAEHSLEYISDITDVSVDVLEKLEPIFLFDLCRRGELPGLKLKQTEYVSVGELLCPVKTIFGVWKYKPINESHFLKVMKNKANSTPYDNDQVNYIGKTNKTRCADILEECKLNKSICEQYPLFVNDKNQIRDGQHRAAALYYLYGHDFQVKIQRIETSRNNGNEPILQRIVRFFKCMIYEIISWLKQQKRKHNCSKKDKKNYMTAISNQVNTESFNRLKIDRNLCVQAFFVDSDYALSNYPVLIRKLNANMKDIITVLESHNLTVIQGHKLENTSFIYGLGEDYLILDNSNRPVAYLQDKLSSYAMSVNSFMPYSPVIQKYLNSFSDVPETILYVLRLLKCMFDKKQKGFYPNDMEYFESHKYVLNDLFFEKDGLVEEVFFGYSDRMKELLHKGAYKEIIDDYRKFEY